MQEEFAVSNQQEYKLSNISERVELVIYSVVSFFLPLMIGHPQLLVGILVNAAIVMAALNIRGYKALPILLMPSLGVLCRGAIFGTFTPLMIYMIPFIWLGNFMLFYTFKSLMLERKVNRFITLGIGSALKMIFLFSMAFIFVKFALLPAIFLTTMGMFQLYTAISGGLLAFGLQALKKKITF